MRKLTLAQRSRAGVKTYRSPCERVRAECLHYHAGHRDAVPVCRRAVTACRSECKRNPRLCGEKLSIPGWGLGRAAAKTEREYAGESNGLMEPLIAFVVIGAGLALLYFVHRKK